MILTFVQKVNPSKNRNFPSQEYDFLNYSGFLDRIWWIADDYIKSSDFMASGNSVFQSKALIR